MIKVERGVPLPEKSGRGDGYKYPWAQMKVGDSFIVEKTDKSHSGTVATSAITSRKKRYPDEDYKSKTAQGVTRIWRTK